MVTSASSQQLSEEEKRIRGEIEKRTGKSPEELYEQREQRVRDAIQLKESDRVPMLLGLGYFPAQYVGVSASTAYYDPVTWQRACIKTTLDFDPDLYGAAAGGNSGLVLEALDAQQMRWPGGNLPPDIPNQFVEGEYMKEDEYDLFLNDPSDFTLRYYLPRVYGVFGPLSKLPPLRNLSGMGLTGITPLFATPEFRQLAEALYKAGQAEEKWRQTVGNMEEAMARLGYPPQGHMGGVGGAPFDFISDFLRGMRGSMLDMYRHPDKLLAACDKVLEWRLERAVPADPKKRGNPKRVFMALHRGSDGFMSKKQFETFYWPGLKKAIQTTIDLGFVPIPFCEGKWDSRLEYLRELPKGKVIYRFAETDMAKAKEVLGDHSCIMGNVPVSLLQAGSVSEVEEYCKNLIKVCGKGGGFIMTASSASIEGSKPENVRAMVESVKKFSAN